MYMKKMSKLMAALLALALCLYAKDHGLPLPGGIITMSAWTDVSLSGASYETNYEIDPLFGNSRENMLYQCSYIGGANPRNPYLAPLFGDFSGFPPMLMQDKINTLALLSSGAVRTDAPCVQTGPAWGSTFTPVERPAVPPVFNPDQLPEL